MGYFYSVIDSSNERLDLGIRVPKGQQRNEQGSTYGEICRGNSIRRTNGEIYKSVYWEQETER